MKVKNHYLMYIAVFGMLVTLSCIDQNQDGRKTEANEDNDSVEECSFPEINNSGLVRSPGEIPVNTGNGSIKKARCSKPFKLVFVQINAETADIKEKAAVITENWMRSTPLNEYRDCVETVVLNNTCPASNTSQRSLLLKEARACAIKDPSSVNYTRIVAIPNVEGQVGGCADGDVALVYNGEGECYGDFSLLVIHELGHTFGLCDEGYGIIKNDKCSAGFCACKDEDTTDSNVYCGSCNGSCECCPNRPEEDSIMCAIDVCENGCTHGVKFTPASYQWLSKELAPYCQHDE